MVNEFDYKFGILQEDREGLVPSSEVTLEEPKEFSWSMTSPINGLLMDSIDGTKKLNNMLLEYQRFCWVTDFTWPSRDKSVNIQPNHMLINIT